MKTLNLIDKNKSDIKYIIHQFPDGEKHLEIIPEELDYCHIDIKCRILSFDDLFIVLQAIYILESKCSTILISIYYMITSRMDRAMSNWRANSLNIFASSLCCNADKVTIYEPHSDKTREYLEEYILFSDKICEVILPWRNKILFNLDNDKFTLCFPDEGAKKRYSGLFSNKSIIYAEKKRASDGTIESMKLIDDSDQDLVIVKDNIVVIDDLCDGGGTFIKLAEVLDDKFPNSNRILIVTHMIQKEAIQRLSEYYDEIYITNSFKDWEKETLPINVTVIDIINE